MQDDTLLTQYANDGSEAAFSQIVARHMTLVYRTCLRETVSASQAEDAAQVVFLLLARKAKSLRAGPSLAGWLYQTARFVAKDVRKQEARRRVKEERVMQEIAHAQEPPAPEWNGVEPLLNAALSALKPAEREAVLLRFLEGHSLAETGSFLGLTEDAARMRVTRAVEKMRRYLTSHGAAVTSVLLTALLTSEAARPISAHAAATITQGTLHALSIGPTANVLLLSKGVSHTMKIIKVKYAALAVVFLLTGASVPPLVHALSQRKIVKQIAAPVPFPQTRRQAFQLGLTLRACDLQAQQYVTQVSNISSILNQTMSAMAEIDEASQNTPEVRKEQAAYYQRAAMILGQMGAPADARQWYAQASARFSKPLVSSEAAKAEAKANYAAIQFSPQHPADPRFGTEAQLATDYAEQAELTAVYKNAPVSQAHIADWLALNNPASAWDAQLGAYTATLYSKTSLPGFFPATELTDPANSLLRSVPQGTPEAAQESLRTLVSYLNGLHLKNPPNRLILWPGDATNKQISLAYERLRKLYSNPTS